MRITALEGRAAPGLALGRTFAPGEPLSVPAGVRVSLALSDFVSLRLGGPALVSWLPDAEPALLVHEGVLAVDCAPRGMRTSTAALWLATPVARLEVPDSARFALRAHPQGGSALAVVSGQVRLQQQDADPVALTAGVSRCLGAGAARPGAAHFADLEAAERALAGRPSLRPLAAPALEQALEAADAAVQAARERERALLAEHARRVAAGDTGADQVRRQLANTAAQLHLGRERVRSLRARLAARLLGGTPAATQSALLDRSPDR